jgi:glycosyltransferase involved in cell wall biosynthesis
MLRVKKPKVVIIGLLPPPYIGPSIATQKLIKSETILKAFEVLFLDISDNRAPVNIGKLDLINCYLAMLHILRFFFMLLKRPHLVYLGISQGFWGFLRDMGLLIPAAIFKRKIILHLRGSEFDRFFKTLPRSIQTIALWVFKRVSAVIVLGESLRYIFKDFVQPEKIFVVPNGIDYLQFDQIKGRTRLKVPSRADILYLASLKERKGLFQFIKALPFVLRKFPDTRITIAGTWQSLSEKEETLELVEKNKLNGQIKFTGEVAGVDKLKLYKTHDIFVFPPIQPEGMPWVILEAMSAKLPIVTTHQGTIPEVVVHGKSGFIIEPYPEEIAKCLCHLIENPELAKKLGEYGRHRIENLYSEEVYFQNIEKIFQYAINYP